MALQSPTAMLTQRVREELAAEFTPAKPVHVSCAPASLDVMGGVAEDTGSLVLSTTLDRIAAVALQARDDRQIQIFSFNLFDEHRPFTFRIPLDALTSFPIEKLREEFNAPGRRWAGHVAGCLFVLHESKLVDLADPKHFGLNLAISSAIPSSVGVGSTAAMEAAVMMNLVDHFGIREKTHGTKMAELCQRVRTHVLGTSCGIVGQMACFCGESNSLLRMICQPHELQPTLALPPGVCLFGINSNVSREDRHARRRKMLCAALMGQQLVMDRLRQMGAAAGKTLVGDPLRGYLANLDPEHYKTLFRPGLPETIKGRVFLEGREKTIDPAFEIEPEQEYLIQHALDHHVLEARRVRRFAEFLEAAATALGASRKLLLDKAGHLMYASHLSYTNDAMLGDDNCDLLVELVRKQRHAGLYRARMTAGGCGGTVAVLAEASDAANAAIEQIMDVYEKRTGRKPEMFTAAASGAASMSS